MARSLAVRSALFALLIAVTGLSGAQDLRAPPSNDSFANRIDAEGYDLFGVSYSIPNAEDATIQSGSVPPEPAPSCSGGTFAFFHSIWFELRVDRTIELKVDTSTSTLNNGATNNTAIALYSSSGTPASFSTLTEVACSTNGTGAGQFTYMPVSPGTYYLQVGAEVPLSNPSDTDTYRLDFRSRLQLLPNTDFGTGTPVLEPWKVTGTGTTGDNVKCDAPIRVIDACSFKFKTSATESSILSTVYTNMGVLPHSFVSGGKYAGFALDVSYATERAQTNAKAILQVTLHNGTVLKDSAPVGSVDDIYVDPPFQVFPIKAKVKIKHTGKSGKPLYITQVLLYYGIE